MDTEEDIEEYDNSMAIRQQPERPLPVEESTCVKWYRYTILSRKEKETLKRWLTSLPTECVDALSRIYSILVGEQKKGMNIFPDLNRVLTPFGLIEPDATYALIVGKAPYKDGTATGIPVESIKIKKGEQTRPATPTLIAFKHAAYCMGVKKGDFNCMPAYYENGILVLNASFTAQQCRDRRREQSKDHTTLWATFMYPFLRYCQSRGIAMLLLGQDAGRLGKAVEGYEYLYKSPFPANESVSFDNDVEFLYTSIQEIKGESKSLLDA